MTKGLDYFKGHFDLDFTLFSEMCVNLQKIQDIKITTKYSYSFSVYSYNLKLINKIHFIVFCFCVWSNTALLIYHTQRPLSYLHGWCKGFSVFLELKKRTREQLSAQYALIAQHACSTRPSQTGSSICPGFISYPSSQNLSFFSFNYSKLCLIR